MDLTMSMETVVELQEKLMRYYLYLTKSHWDAEDLAQEAWLKAFGDSKVTNHSNPQALLLRIAKNSWIDHTRRLKIQRRYIDQENKMFQQAPSDSSLGQLEFILQAIIKHMTPLQRSVFLLRDVYDYSILETAQILHTSQGAVKAALHRARISCNDIKRDLEAEVVLKSTQDEYDQSLLSSMVIAYEQGSMATVLALAMEGEWEPSTAWAIAHNQLLKVNSGDRKERSMTYTPQSIAA